MSDQDWIQDAVTRSLRTMLLGQIKETPTGDVYKLELFDWYVKETETLLSELLWKRFSWMQSGIVQWICPGRLTSSGPLITATATYKTGDSYEKDFTCGNNGVHDLGPDRVWRWR